MLKQFVLIFLFLSLFAEEVSNIRQLTFPEMGFEKAGEAYFSPDGSKIIFQAVPFGKLHYQMYVMDLEEGIPRMVSNGEGSCTCGFFHPSGEKIIFAASPIIPKPTKGRYTWDLTPYMNIYEANLDGSELKPLTTGSAYHAECAYSPDGEEIVYASNESGSMNLYIMKSDGTSSRLLTTTHSSYNGGPFFSPDGQRIIFRSDRQKEHYLQIYLINADGSGESQITNNSAVNWAPFWHPNGRQIAFTKSMRGHCSYQIVLYDLETGEEQLITEHSSFNGLPVFNHDGSKLMWTSKRAGSCQVFMADFKLK